MTTQVYLVKRPLRERHKNGQQKYRWALRWPDPTTGRFCCEATGTADKTEAEALRKVKWAELNLPQPTTEPEPEAEPEPGPTWDDCGRALDRAMQADKLRPSSIADALLTLKALRGMFPTAASPADITADQAHEYKRRRSELGRSAWTVRGDLASLKATFGKWLGKECGLLDPAANPFANVKPPRCDDPEVRIVAAVETQELFTWLADRWNNWRLPVVYLEVAALLGWRATEIASMKADDLMPDGFVRVAAESCKTRRHKYGWLPEELHSELSACAATGWAFGRFSDELRRLLILWRRQPHHAAKVREFQPERLVGWMQDELQRFCAERVKEADKARAEAKEAGLPLPPEAPQAFTLHDFRRTAITGMQMAGVSEKDVSAMVGATPEVIRRHYEKLDQQAIAKRNVERRLGADAPARLRFQDPQSLRAGCARDVDKGGQTAQVVVA